MKESRGIVLYIDPPSPHFLRDQLFNVDDGRLTGDHSLAPYAHLRNFFTSRGIGVHTADHLPDATAGIQNIYVSMGMLRNYRRMTRRKDTVLSAFFAMECPIVQPSLYRALNQVQRYVKRIFSWSDSQSIERFVGAPLKCEPFRWPQAFDAVHERIWARTDREFMVMINANKVPRLNWRELYSERVRAVEYFSRTGEIDLYGVGWDGPPFRVGKSWVPNVLLRAHRAFLSQWQRFHSDPLLEAVRRAYRGPAVSKAETLGRYTFAICFENMVLKGWITEKIFDCFFAGTIPIYRGAPDIEDHVPPECFIDMRRFASYADLRSFLKFMGEAEIRNYRENAREYLKSPQFRPFSKDAFVGLFHRIVEEDTGVRIPY